jgi:hypothetical protein
MTAKKVKTEEETRTQERETLATIIGRCFHTFKQTKSGDDGVQYQGVVRARVEEGIYLVQYFEWFVGEPSTMALVRIEDMLAWQFYEDNKHMNFWYEHRYHKPSPETDEAA